MTGLITWWRSRRAARELDGCDVDATDPEYLTEDGDQTDALVMFADVWDDPAAVETRRAELIEWAAAVAEADDA
jgi:hypothetical protein